MGLSKALSAFGREAKSDDFYWVEVAKLDFSQELERQRRLQGLSYSALAKKLGTSAAYISKVFRGDANLTIESMVKLARASGGKLSIQVADEQADGRRWAGTMRSMVQNAANQPRMSSTATVISISQYSRNGEPIAA